MLSKRLMLHLMLDRDYKIKEISEILSFSKETVRVHKTRREYGSNVYRKIIIKLSNRQKTKEFWKKFEKIIRPLGYAMSMKSDMKARNKYLNAVFEEN